MGEPITKLSEVLPPLIFGTATFNYQFNVDPFALRPNQVVKSALEHGVRAFDTSPYYGPAEEILGAALSTDYCKSHFPREKYYILTKVGRIAANEFDYSASWVRQSVKRSCQRLKTDYLDVVYCHDIEFVSPEEVLTAVREMRRIRDEEGTIKHVGICGYPVHVLCDLAEKILQQTGEPIDIVQSYANFTLQNTKLLSEGLRRLANANVQIVTNASLLGMGLLRLQGPPVGAMGDWHPAPDGLREAAKTAGKWVEKRGEKLEVVAVRFALEDWLREGAQVGTSAPPFGNVGDAGISSLPLLQPKLGVNVMGVSSTAELDETMRVWHSVIDGLADSLNEEPSIDPPSVAVKDHEWSLQRRQGLRSLSKGIRENLGEWVDYAWASPEPGFVNKRQLSSNKKD